MRRTLALLLVPAILLAQAVVGISPGKSLCIVLEACCGTHESHAHASLAHRHHHGFAVALDATESHAGARHLHVGCTEATHAHEDAEPHGSSHGDDDGCDGSTGHFHLSVPDDAGSLRSACSNEVLPVESGAVDLPETLVIDVDALGARMDLVRPPPWIWPTCDQRRAIETDRLLI